MLNFSDYNYTKYSKDPSFKKRMAGDVFERMSGEKGWQAQSTSAANLPEGISTTNTNANAGGNSSKSKKSTSSLVRDKVLSDRDNASNYISDYANSRMQEIHEYMKTPEYAEMMKASEQRLFDEAGVSSREEYFASDAHKQRRAQAQADGAAHKAKQAKLKAQGIHV